MYGKKLRQAATVALCLISLNALAAQDFSALSKQELMQLKPDEMGEEDRNAFRDEMRKRTANMNSTEKEEFRNQTRQKLTVRTRLTLLQFDTTLKSLCNVHFPLCQHQEHDLI